MPVTDPFRAALDVQNYRRERYQYVLSQHGKVKQLTANGRWLVPPEQRPANWQKMNLKEPEDLK